MQDFIEYQGLLSKLSKQDLNDLFLYLKSYKIKRKETLGIPKYLSFGLEIEFEKLALELTKQELGAIKDFKYYIVHEEKSVHTISAGKLIGGEVSTDILHDTKRDWIKVFKLYNTLKKLGAISTDKCALHIHIGAQIFGEDIEYLKRFIKVWCIFEDIAFKFGYQDTNMPRNIENMKIFCPPLAPKFKKVLQKEPHYINDACIPNEFNFGKRNAVAFHQYHYLTSEEERNNDIEIRCPNGTLNPIVVQNNVNFFIKLMLYVTSSVYDDKLINRLMNKIGNKTIEDYQTLDIKKALILSDLIFSITVDKIDFLKGYVKDSDTLIR